mmetsp:Transcript_11316/g.17173  ORF Transcript_11316/g.17173 Transcript_11316/m.17173 type:complete len:99 (-) Transcript_11316:987-1283(-)
MIFIILSQFKLKSCPVGVRKSPERRRIRKVRPNGIRKKKSERNNSTRELPCQSKEVLNLHLLFLKDAFHCSLNPNLAPVNSQNQLRQRLHLGAGQIID